MSTTVCHGFAPSFCAKRKGRAGVGSNALGARLLSFRGWKSNGNSACACGTSYPSPTLPLRFAQREGAICGAAL